MFRPVKSHCLDPDQLRSRLKHLIAELFRLDLVDPDKIADNEALIGGSLGLDSLDALELAMCVEEEFGITITSRAESVCAFTSIASLAGYIQARSEAAQTVSSHPLPAFILQPSH